MGRPGTRLYGPLYTALSVINTPMPFPLEATCGFSRHVSPSGLAETLTVSGEAPLVDVSTAEIGGHISATELNDLPSFNRNYMALAGSVPGVVFLPHAEFLNDGIQANGRPTEANNIVFDGASNTDDLRGSNVGGQTRAANESIQEGRS